MANLVPRKIVRHDASVREEVLKGAERVYEAVAATLGPRSDNVIIGRPWGVPAVLHDGVRVAEEVVPLKNEIENVGAELVVQAAQQTGNVGDGTTTSTVLTYSIAKKAHELIAAGMQSMAVRSGIERAVKAVAEYIRENATPVDGEDALKQVAQVSAQLPDIGDMVVEAVKQVGADGVITVEESNTTETFVEVKQGMEFDRGYKSPHFVTNHETGEAEVEDAYVLITDMRIAAMHGEFLPALEVIVNQKQIKNLVVIADDIDGEALATLIVNKVKGAMRTLAIQAPNFGEKRQAILEDIATVTGGTVVSGEKGHTFKEFDADWLGRAARVISSDKSTIIVDGAGDEKAVADRAASIKKKADHGDTGEFDREKLLERYAKLTTGVAIVHVGAKTESEIKERKERAIDAISAVKAASAEGIVPGGGSALIRAAAAALHDFATDNAAEEAGVQVVREACAAPFNRLLINAGYDPGEYRRSVTDQLGIGLDVTTGKVVDMVQAGIIDPAKVVRSALENAASSAIMILTGKVVIVEDKSTDQSKDVTAY